MDKISELEIGVGISQSAKEKKEQAEETVAEYSVDCSRCKEKDAEISHLRQQILAAGLNLAKAQDNLTSMINLIGSKNEHDI